jgi:hypothetical protein
MVGPDSFGQQGRLQATRGIEMHWSNTFDPVKIMNMKRMTRIVVLFITLAVVSQSLWADVRASLSRTAIQEGDTVTLHILASGGSDDADPDLSVLADSFDILGTGSSHQTSIVNGKISSSRQWQVELMPKHQGEISVPPIPLGNQATSAMTLTVSAQSQAAIAAAGEPVFIKTQLQPPPGETVHVQQQLRYTLQLFYRERLYDGSFDGPHIDNALIERLGDDVQYQTTVNGSQYQVIERRYAIFPEQSGTLEIAPVTFTGRLAGQVRQRMPSMQMDEMMERFFGSSSMASPGKRLRLRGEGYRIDVQPRPASYSGQYWLPGEQLVLTDSWATGPPEFRAGEPVTRVITLQARGLESSHLPDITLADSPNMRLYPESPVYKNHTDGEWVLGSVERSFAYVPTTAGMQTIPAISIDWWDTKTGEQRTAELPAWTINVEPGDGVITAQLPAPTDVTNKQPGESIVATPLDEPGSDATGNRQWARLSYWPWLLLAATVILAGALLLSRRRGVARKADESSVPRRATRAALRRACESNDMSAAARALLDWAATEWPDDPPRNLGVLATRLDHGREEIEALAEALYAAGGKAWQGSELWQVFDTGLQDRADSRKKTRSQSGLSPLYPDWKH